MKGCILGRPRAPSTSSQFRPFVRIMDCGTINVFCVVVGVSPSVAKVALMAPVSDSSPLEPFRFAYEGPWHLVAN